MIRSAAVLALFLASSAAAQQPQQAPMRHEMAAPVAPAGETAAASAFRQANEAMMREMNVPLTGDADRDFVNAMLPHHKGAVEMAKLQLKYGRNPELRRLARAIITAQDKEIRQMKAWLRQHPAPQ